MKRILLMFLCILATIKSSAQVTAYQAPNIAQCGYEIFDLTVQDDIIRGNQDPENYSVTYHTTNSNAQTGVSPIANPSAYIGISQETIYARLINNITGEFAISFFQLIITTGPNVGTFSNISVCTFYNLPALSVGNYYTGPQGTGAVIPVGTAITTTQTIYVYASTTTCSSQASFVVTVIPSIRLDSFSNIVACGSYTLPALTNGNYYTGPGGTGTSLFAGTSITASMTLYIYASNGICSNERSFTITIGAGSNDFQDVNSCWPYTLPDLETGEYRTAPNGGGTVIPVGTVINSTQTIYVYNSENSGCWADVHFTVHVGSSDNVLPPNPLTVCDINNDGIGTFNLEIAAQEFLLHNPQVTDIAFYLTQAGAQTQTNAIQNTQAFVGVEIYEITIYIGFLYDNCLGYLPLQLLVIPCEGSSTLTGIVTLDDEGNGCDDGDNPVAGIMVSYNSGNYVFNTFTDANGTYTFNNVGEGNVTVWIQNINGQGFTASPTNVTLHLPEDATVNNFCISVPAPYSDVATYIIPALQAVAGFPAGYYVAATNYGTTTVSGVINLTYNGALVSNPVTTGATQSGNTLAWTYNNLAPYQTIYKYVSFTVAVPPIVNSGTILSYTATITPVNSDINLDNNAYAFNQVAVNSYDPNDITVHEGRYITETQAEGFLTYTIRFQNTGSANAQNIKVSLPLDENLDWSTFQPIGSSHVYRANRSAEGLDFVFDGIQLPFEDANEPASHGFVSFRIKPLQTVGLGDSMQETANIYFDFNEAIVTNTAITTVQNTAGITDFGKRGIKLYPNPANNNVTIQLENAQQAEIIIADVLGKTVLYTKMEAQSKVIDVTSLKAGMYFVTTKSNAGTTTQKLVKK
ncbi:DUF7619 domain-containing protein [Flavobacterium psychrotrophum]|uniref:DUF7619 domain-containing protein n=1 Tax=Flavobacterium psychrotrophum TaxID=2294119 RepID=UPI000E30F704|nr:T9SS type A sorting domain-containing protein [Flavobacterium psychrotrophum]